MYLIESIKPRDENYYNWWHDECIGRRCVVDRKELGFSLIMRVEGLLTPGAWSDFHTSRVVAVQENDGYLFIDTRNTFYVMRRLPDDSIR